MGNLGSEAISRRTVTRGAAWATPAIFVGAAAPAMAGSVTCTDSLVCPTTPMTLQGGSNLSVTMITTITGGTRYTLDLGQWNTPAVDFTHSCPGVPATTITSTGYYLNWGTWTGVCDTSNGSGSVSNFTTADGVAHTATLKSSTPNGCSPMTAGAGLAVSAIIDTNVPYDLFKVCQKSMNLGTVSIPFTVTYLNDLDPIASCSYKLNLTFKTGCQPNYVSSWSIS